MAQTLSLIVINGCDVIEMNLWTDKFCFRLSINDCSSEFTVEIIPQKVIYINTSHNFFILFVFYLNTEIINFRNFIKKNMVFILTKSRSAFLYKAIIMIITLVQKMKFMLETRAPPNFFRPTNGIVLVQFQFLFPTER